MGTVLTQDMLNRDICKYLETKPSLSLFHIPTDDSDDDNNVKDAGEILFHEPSVSHSTILRNLCTHSLSEKVNNFSADYKNYSSHCTILLSFDIHIVLHSLGEVIVKPFDDSMHRMRNLYFTIQRIQRKSD